MLHSIEADREAAPNRSGCHSLNVAVAWPPSAVHRGGSVSEPRDRHCSAQIRVAEIRGSNQGVLDLTKKSSRTGYEFPRHGGFYIATWAVAYERTKEPAFLQAIESLLDGFEARRNKVTGIMPAESNTSELV